MEIESLEIEDVKLIKPRRFTDDRGYFEQSWHKQQYKDAGIDVEFVQDNLSYSKNGTLRGLHYQLKKPQAKLVSVVSGRVFDVAVDVRRSSPSFGQWVGAELSAENGYQLYIPRGFAHGFFVLSETAVFSYKCDNFYTPGDEYSIHCHSPELAIDWPEVASPLLSAKDAEAPNFNVISTEFLFA